MRALTAILGSTLALAFAACAPGTTVEGPGSPGARKLDPPVTVRVQNNNWMDLAVYVVHGSTRMRLGTVTGMSTQTLVIPRSSLSASGQVRLLADPIGSPRGYLSDAIHVQPGQRVALEVGHNINISFVTVWN